MKAYKILTDSSYSYDNSRTFRVPAFSKILNIFKEHTTMSILIEYDEYEEDSKTFLIKTFEGGLYSDIDFSNIYSYEYWGTITESKPILVNNSNVAHNGFHINMNIMSENKYTHIFYNELKSIAEMRDDILNEII